MNSEVIQHLISQRRGEQRRAEEEKVHDDLGQKIALGHLVCPFFCSRGWTVHLPSGPSQGPLVSGGPT